MAKTNFGPYGISINYEVDPRHATELHDTLAADIKAVKNTYKNFNLVTYKNWAGPLQYYHAFIPFEKFGELDQWPGSQNSALASEGKIKTHASTLFADSSSTVLELVPELSTKAPRKPGKYALTLVFKLDAGAESEFLNAGKNLLSSAPAHSVLTYKNFAGTTHSYHAYIPFNSFAELDKWEADAGHIGKNTVTDCVVSIAEFVPNLSNLV